MPVDLTQSNCLLPRAIILAGGASSRFGTNKAVADIGGKTLTAFLVDELLQLFSRVTVVAKAPDMLGITPHPRVRLLQEADPRQALLVGLVTGLRHADRELNYVIGCDMPGVAPAAIRALHALARKHDGALRCNADGELQPLGGFYARRCLPRLEAWLSAEDFRMRGIVQRLDIAPLPFAQLRRLDPELRSCWNINTPEDLRRVGEFPHL